MTVLSFCFSCSQNEVLQENSLPYTEADYARIVEKYALAPITNQGSIEKAQSLQAVTPQQLDEMLTSFFNTSADFTLNENKAVTRSNVVVMTGNSIQCRVDVHLDVDEVRGISSNVYYHGLSDVFLVYSHLSADTDKNGHVITFRCNGEVVVKVIWQGIELKRVPVTIMGKYDVSTGHGELTFY